MGKVRTLKWFCRTGSNRACITTSARKLPHARLIVASVMIMFIIRSKPFLQKVASVAIACYWTRSMRSPAFQRPNAMLASRCDWVFSCDLIFITKFFGLPYTLLAHSFCIANGSPNNQQLWQLASSSLARIRAIVVLFPLPQKVHGVFFREHASVAVLACDSKWSFWVAWTVLKDCCSQFGWQCAQLKENAIRRVVERQV